MINITTLNEKDRLDILNRNFLLSTSSSIKDIIDYTTHRVSLVYEQMQWEDAPKSRLTLDNAKININSIDTLIFIVNSYAYVYTFTNIESLDNLDKEKCLYFIDKESLNNSNG